VLNLAEPQHLDPEREKRAETMPTKENEIGAFVKERRRAAKLTQQELAEIAGVGTRFVSELERGKPTVQLAEVDAVLRVFGKRIGIVDSPRELGDDRI
jgi:y4mF family transcriptional regulator